jgi:steroid delta-isomerase-like uncharacterized protein
MNAQDLIRTSTDTWNRRDRDRHLAVHAEDCEVSGPAFSLEGHDGLGEWWDQYTSAFPDDQITVTRTAVDESSGLAFEESVIEGTHQRPLVTPHGSQVPATGRRVTVPFCTVHQQHDGRIVSSRLYHDLVDLLSQLDLV